MTKTQKLAGIFALTFFCTLMSVEMKLSQVPLSKTLGMIAHSLDKDLVFVSTQDPLVDVKLEGIEAGSLIALLSKQAGLAMTETANAYLIADEIHEELLAREIVDDPMQFMLKFEKAAMPVVLSALTQGARKTLSGTDRPEGFVTLKLNGTPWNRALYYVLALSGFEGEISSTSVHLKRYQKKETMAKTQATVGDEEQKALIRAMQDTGFKLLQQTYSGKNVLLSPYSIQTALNMAITGADGKTLKQMQEALNTTLSPQQISLVSRSLSFTGSFKQANALILNPAIDLISPAYIQNLSDSFQAAVIREHSLDYINAWVLEKTQGKIPKILSHLHPNSVAVILNAIYFKGDWQEKFSAQQTRSEDFFETKESKVSADFMQRSGSYGLVEFEDYMAISLPYSGGEQVMLILLPNEDKDLSDVVGKLSETSIGPVINEVLLSDPRRVKLSIPRFKMDYDMSLKEPLEQLGITDAFSESEADFSGMTGRPSKGLIFIDQIRHRATLEVNEEGSEASAATAIGFATRSMAVIPEFKANRPFCLMIVDTKSQLPLFYGIVTRP